MYVFTDIRASQQVLQALAAYGHLPISCAPHPALDPATASHPDMLLFPFDTGIFVHKDYAFKTDGLYQLPISRSPGRKYPHDVLLNAARIGKYIVCRPDVTAPEILSYARANGLTVLPVRQGYAKCNLCVVSDRAAITEDDSIAAALCKQGFDVLRVAPGGVSLPGYPYGFIGGASGNDGTHVFFCGDLALHPEGERIAAFCKKHQKQPVSLAKHPLHDVGSLLFFDENEK